MLFFFLILLLAGAPCFATEPIDLQQLWNQAHSKNLAEHPYWLRLLHYHFPVESPGQWHTESDVISPSFFLSSSGRSDPEAELIATLSALLEDLPEDPDQHAQCRFMARFQWLKSQLDFSKTTLKKLPCPRFEQWISLEHLDSISLVYVSAYMDNPASIYGHILLKVNSRHPLFGHTLLSPTLNFGAIVDPADHPLMYALKGIFGGYTGRFTDERFYNYNHLYGESELRDLWEYFLNLDDTQKKRLVYHAWELLQGVEFQYYFFLDNCAYRMGELLEMAWDTERLNPPFALWRIPVSIFHRAAQIRVDENPLLGKIALLPSRQRRLQQKFNNLTETQKAILNGASQNPNIENDPEFLKLSLEQQTEILDALIDYFQYQLSQKPADLLVAQKHKILLARSRYPMITRPGKIENPEPPTAGSPPQKIRLGVGYNDALGASTEIGLWTSYHDLGANDAGHLPHSQLVTLDLRLRIYPDQEVVLDQLTLVDIMALNTFPVSLPGNAGMSWDISARVERSTMKCRTCRVLNSSGGIGKSWSTTDRQWLGFALFDGFILGDQANLSRISTGLAPQIGGLWSGSWLKLMFRSQCFRSFAGPTLEDCKIETITSLFPSKNWDFRLETMVYHGREYHVAANYYW
ncbi:MAG: DUF4105 domain-containing protein [SAR324 cluster bacterium]|nr:DUF4105 domain-containing protein [SAR324 cluster bacterium]